MPRSKSASNLHYNYEVRIDDNRPEYCRTQTDLAVCLGVSRSTIRNYFSNIYMNPLQKFKGSNIIINRVKIPIYKSVPVIY